MLKNKKVTALFISLPLALGVTGCFDGEKKEATAKLTIQILPRVPHPVTFSTTPKTVSEFTCIGINVAGEGVLKTRTAVDCTKSVALDLGLFAPVMVPLSGGTIEVQVPVGNQRIIQVYGIISTGLTCPTADTVIFNRPGNTATLPPYEVGRSVVDITGDTTVTINSNWNSAAPKEAFCTDTTASTATGIGVWDSGLWDVATWSD